MKYISNFLARSYSMHFYTHIHLSTPPSAYVEGKYMAPLTLNEHVLSNLFSQRCLAVADRRPLPRHNLFVLNNNRKPGDAGRLALQSHLRELFVQFWGVQVLAPYAE